MNATPLVDVVLVLLIIMVIVPQMTPAHCGRAAGR
jgi:biopolymer transport protein ExbD